MGNCYFCGEESSSKEHIPPKSFFPDTQRKMLIKVDSCDKHNNHKSGDDEYFRFVIVSTAWDKVDEDVKNKIIRSVKRKPLLAKKIINHYGLKVHSLCCD